MREEEGKLGGMDSRMKRCTVLEISERGGEIVQDERMEREGYREVEQRLWKEKEKERGKMADQKEEGTEKENMEQSLREIKEGKYVCLREIKLEERSEGEKMQKERLLEDQGERARENYSKQKSQIKPVKEVRKGKSRDK